MRERRSGLSILLLISVAGVNAAALSAFPGAEGFGAQTPGGRGGKVFAVLNLEDSGPGSLRAACEAEGPRIVIFRVAGIIDLKRSIRITQPFLTLAGQTAPGDGICLRGFDLDIRAHDVVVRYLRSRPGDISGKEVDAIDVGSGAHDVMVDHCSATWAVDENLSPSGSISNVTVQWCIIAEGLNHSVHHKGAHGYGSLVRAAGGVSLHHNLWAHNNARNPRLGENYQIPPYPTFDVRNNVIYNYGDLCSGMTGDHLSVNYVANYIRPGPNSNPKHGVIVFTDTADANYFVAENVVDGNATATQDNGNLFDRTECNGKKLVTREAKPFATPEIKTTSATLALAEVLRGAGATRPVRDAVDQQIVRDVRQRTGAIIDSPKQVGGWPEYRTAARPADSDGDGIPDPWEQKHRLNPGDPDDANADADGDGYTNIEEFLNGTHPRKPD
jgi:pectate lyase